MATAYMTAGGNNNKKAAILLTIGFTGQLKGWWDNIVTEDQRNNILGAYKPDSVTLQPIGEDALNTLLYAITKHFIGDPLQLQQRAGEQLVNLYCPTMSDYRWYKDMFLCKLYVRPDGGADYWKERFLVGLPKLFSEKVKNKIKRNYSLF